MHLCNCWDGTFRTSSINRNTSGHSVENLRLTAHLVRKPTLNRVNDNPCTFGAVVFEPISQYSVYKHRLNSASFTGNKLEDHLLSSQPTNSVNIFTTNVMDFPQIPLTGPKDLPSFSSTKSHLCQYAILITETGKNCDKLGLTLFSSSCVSLPDFHGWW